MKTYGWRKTAQRSSESGQALVFLVLALSITFLGVRRGGAFGGHEQSVVPPPGGAERG